MKALLNEPSISEAFKLRAILNLEEIQNHDMIYVYHHLQVGGDLKLVPAGTNLAGDLRMKVFFKEFVLGFVTIGGVLGEYYEGQAEIWAEISGLTKKKYHPVQEVNIALQALKLKKVS